MPALGVLVFIAQLAMAVHVARTGRSYYWIYIIIFVPFLGMAVYAAVELLPELMNGRTGRQATAGLAQAINPGKRLRDAERQVEITPTAANKAALAAELLRLGQPEKAIALYREVLTGIHATDPAPMLALAQAYFAAGQPAEAQSTLEALRAANPEINSPEGHLLYARSLEVQDKTAEALEEYAALIPYYPGQEARCRYALLLEKTGRMAEAQALFAEICQAIDYGPRHQYRVQREWYDLAKRHRSGA